MIDFIHILAAVLATYRLTELITIDRITEPLRSKWPVYFWTCQRCVSVWMGLLVTGIYVTYPFVLWPFALSGAFIMGTLLLGRIMKVGPPAGHKRLTVDMDGGGNIQLSYCDFDASGIAEVCSLLMAGLREQGFRDAVKKKK